MADRAKRARATAARPIVKPASNKEVAGPPKKPPAQFLGRTCRLRLVQESEAWLTGTLLAYSGADMQTCEIELDGADASAPRRVEKVHLSTQPVHVADEVAWGPEGGADSAEGLAAAGGGRRDDARGGSGGYVDGLVPMLTFAPLGPAEFDGAAGQRLAQSLETGEHVWIKRECTRPLAAHMLRRRTRERLKKAVDAALAHQRSLLSASAKAAKKGVVGKRLAVYWPIDDAWYSGVIEAWDAKAGQHRVLYDDGCAPPQSVATHARLPTRAPVRVHAKPTPPCACAVRATFAWRARAPRTSRTRSTTDDVRALCALWLCALCALRASPCFACAAWPRASACTRRRHESSFLRRTRPRSTSTRCMATATSARGLAAC
jgi:hypothetical protein